MTAEQRAKDILRQALGRDDAVFQPQQWEAISSLVEDRKRVLLVQRTGWGKSAVYFISTRLLRDRGAGPTIIISPLLALMRNQVEAAAKYSVRLAAHNSSNSPEENQDAESRFLADELDALIISPERLANPDFYGSVLQPAAERIGLFVIDEAHCISDWGHDFRPDYKRIKNVIAALPRNVPVAATTATANHRVMEDIALQLGERLSVLRGPLSRESLTLQNIPSLKRSQRLAWLADTIPQLEGSGIIYTLTTRDADQVATWLQSRGIEAEAYYGSISGLSSEENATRRQQLEDDLLHNKLKALVATSALGMGFDKPDLAFVIHYQCPGSVIGYYQQAGRAGRGIPAAHAVLMSGAEDDDIQEFFIANAFPAEETVQQILTVLRADNNNLRLSEVLQRVNAPNKKIEAALKFLMSESPAPVTLVSEGSSKLYAPTAINYRLPSTVIERLSNLRRDEWGVMREYMEHGGCLMQFLTNELDDIDPAPCGKCSNCDESKALTMGYGQETAKAAAEFLENVFVPVQPRKQIVPTDFRHYNFPRNLVQAGLNFDEGRALCVWGEAGWGEIAAEDKRAGVFRPSLVAASARMIMERWLPVPFPEWVTYVPSLARPQLVADFAGSLAQELGLPCSSVVFKARRNKPQKLMENSSFRSKNLDGVFEVRGEVLGGPVLLIDDAVDSRWTFTVIAALLRQAGVEKVYPYAVVSTSPGS